jgi:hypothetical protein
MAWLAQVHMKARDCQLLVRIVDLWSLTIVSDNADIIVPAPTRHKLLGC